MTPAQAVSIRAVWQTLGENGNTLARSWSRLIGDCEPAELIKLAETLASKLPKLYGDTAELIAVTGFILEHEGDSLENLGALLLPKWVEDIGPQPSGPTHDAVVIDDILDLMLERCICSLCGSQCQAHHNHMGDQWRCSQCGSEWPEREVSQLRENGKSGLRARLAWDELTGGEPWPDDLEEDPDAD